MRYQRRMVGQVPVFVEVDSIGRPVCVAGALHILGTYEAHRDPETLAAAAIGRLLAPTEPTKIICLGLNYRHHAEEMNKPVPAEPRLFMKPSTAVIGDGATILLPPSSAEVHHEGELAIVIGRHARRVAEEEALGFVAGYTIMNDITARDIQRRENKYTRAKGFDTFAPLGPTVVTDIDASDLRLVTRVNGEIRQDSRTSDMIFGFRTIIAFVTEIMTLLPGDIISTGTPSGVGPIVDGDTVSVTIDGIGTLTNAVGTEGC